MTCRSRPVGRHRPPISLRHAPLGLPPDEGLVTVVGSGSRNRRAELQRRLLSGPESTGVRNESVFRMRVEWARWAIEQFDAAERGSQQSTV